MTTSPSLFPRALALATVALAGLALSGCSIIGNITGGGANNGPTDEASGSTDVFDLKVGNCLAPSEIEGEVDSVVLVDCAEPHAREAYASLMFDEGDYPGDEVVEDESLDRCTTEFATFVGMDYQESTLDLASIYPTSESWAGGDREILCLISDPAGDVTGTLENAAR